MKASLAHYQAADRGRRNKDWRAIPGSADLMILPDSLTLNSRARQTVRDSWIGASMVRAAKRNVAGTGIDVVPTAKDDKGNLLANLNRNARAHFWRWASDKKFCDVERRQNFWQKQRLAVAERYVTGQFMTVWSYQSPMDATGKIDKRQPVGLRLQSFEAEQLDLTILSYEGREVRNGIELDPDTNEAVAYHFFTRNPNDYLARNLWKSVRVEASRVYHYFDQERVLQSQGVTQFAPVLQEIRDFNRFKDATMWRTIMESCMGMIVKKNLTTPAGFSPLAVNLAAGESTATTTGMNTMDFSPGMVPHLAPGEDVVPYTPSSPGNQYDPFTTVTLRGIGAGVGMSYDQISRHSDGNYSAARQNMLEDWREYEIEQDNLTSDLILPVYTLWFNLAVLEGRFDDEKEFDADEFLDDPHRFTEAACVAPARPWIDPEKEANGYRTLIDYRIITREEIMTGRGKRFSEQVRKIGEERDEAKSEGVLFPEDVESEMKLANAAKFDAMADAAISGTKTSAIPGMPGVPPGAKPAPAAKPGKSDTPEVIDVTIPEKKSKGGLRQLSPKCESLEWNDTDGIASLFNENHDEKGQFAEGGGGGGGGARTEHPLREAHEKWASKISDRKLKQSAQNAHRFRSENPDAFEKMRTEVIHNELKSRGIKVGMQASGQAYIQLSAAPAEVPDYHLATVPEVSCANCRFFIAEKCTAYDFDADPTFVCEAFEAIPASEMTPRGGFGVASPTLSEGEAPIDSPHSEFNDRDLRGVQGTGD